MVIISAEEWWNIVELEHNLGYQWLEGENFYMKL
jgi:hypothetical protein